jgi:hypothetical protein
LDYFESLDEDDEISSNAPSPSKIIDIPSPLVIQCVESLIEASIILDQHELSSCVGDSLSTSSDSLQVSHSLPDWDSYLSNFTSLFVESHISDLEDTFNGLSLLFDDNHCTTTVKPSWSLDIF